MFGVICKKSHVFRDSMLIASLIFASFCMQGQPRLEIKIWDHFQTHFDAMNLMVVSESRNKLLLKIIFF